MYFFALLFVGFGLFILVWGTLYSNLVSTIAGVISTSLFLPAMSSARRTRKENIMIRLLEAPLSKAETATDAAKMLQELAREILQHPQNGRED